MNIEISGATFVRGECAAVWAALHDVELIEQCIPGCRSLVRVSDHAFHLILHIRLGPIQLAFDGDIEELESDPPRRFCLIGRGTGDGAGDAKGKAAITLVEQRGGCKLFYKVEAETHGPLSAAGSRILSGVGKAIATFFAGRFGELVGKGTEAHPAVALQRA